MIPVKVKVIIALQPSREKGLAGVWLTDPGVCLLGILFWLQGQALQALHFDFLELFIAEPALALFFPSAEFKTIFLTSRNRG